MEQVKRAREVTMYELKLFIHGQLYHQELISISAIPVRKMLAKALGKARDPNYKVTIIALTPSRLPGYVRPSVIARHDHSKIRHMRNRGYSTREIAKIYFVATETIRKIIKKEEDD